MEREDIDNIQQEYDMQENQQMIKEQKLEEYCKQSLVLDKDEPLLMEKNKKYCMYPIPPEYKPIYDAYNTHMSMFWRPSEIQFQEDNRQWETKLNANERNFLKYVLAFFAQSDGIVSENISDNFGSEVVLPWARAFYSFQNFIEQVHNEVYSILIDTFIKNEAEKDILFNAIEKMPIIKQKADWMFKWMDGTKAPFPMRLLAFAVIEGVFFSGSFCSIYWIRTKRILPGLCKSNDFIARDESVHTQFAVLLYTKYVKNKIPEELVHYMFEEAVNMEIQFINEALRVNLLGINKEQMAEYIKFCGDRLLQQLGYSKLYNAKQPFTFMDAINQEIKQNFFENRPTEYQIAEIHTVEDDDGEF